MERNVHTITTRCNDLQTFWAPRDAKMRQWYRLIQMIDELKTEKMESFVGNDPRSIFNLVQHMLDVEIPHRVKNVDSLDLDAASISADVNEFFETAWQDIDESFRHSGPRQSIKRSIIGLLLSTGWYSMWTAIGDEGDRAYLDLWNPIQVYPMWDIELGLAEVAHIYTMTGAVANRLCKKNAWATRNSFSSDQKIFDYWWIEVDSNWPFQKTVWNAVVVGTELVKFEQTRFSRIPIFIAPIAGLPDTGPLSEGSPMASSMVSSSSKGERWKEEIGQALIATNENIYKAWNKWWTFSLQLLRDTAQPRIFERSRSGKAIVKPEDVFRRGAIFRGTADDSVEFLSPPAMPLELRSTQLDLEAMMQRGGVSWAMYGNVTGELTAYVMAQISASANQVVKPYQQALQDLYADIDNFWLSDIRENGWNPYDWSPPRKLPKDAKIECKFEIEIPGDLIQRATAARMIDPNFALSYTFVVNKLFPEIKNPLQERARRLADMAELSPENAMIAKIRYYKKQSAALQKTDRDAARLYDLAAQAAEAQLNPVANQAKDSNAPKGAPGNRTENAPPSTTEPVMPV